MESGKSPSAASELGSAQIYKVETTHIPAELWDRYSGNTSAILRNDEYRDRFNRLGVACLRREISPEERQRASVFYETAISKGGPIGEITYQIKHVSTKNTTEVRNRPGWRLTERDRSNAFSAKKKVHQIIKVFDEHWMKISPQEQQRLLKLGMDALDPVSIQNLELNGPSDYCESQSCALKYPQWTEHPELPSKNGKKEHLRRDNKFVEYVDPVDLFAISPKSEELFYNTVCAEGLTTLYLYIYPNASYSVCHIEDGGLGSSFKHNGKGIKIWIIVAREDFARFVKIFIELCDGDDRVSDCGHEFLNKAFSPSVQRLLDAQIPVYIFVQEQGDVMVIDCGVPHEVINIGPPGWGFTKNHVPDLFVKVARYTLEMRTHCMHYNRDRWEVNNANLLTKCLQNLHARMIETRPEIVRRLDDNSASGTWFQPGEDFRKLYHPTGYGEVMAADGEPWTAFFGSESVYCDRERKFMGDGRMPVVATSHSTAVEPNESTHQHASTEMENGGPEDQSISIDAENLEGSLPEETDIQVQGGTSYKCPNCPSVFRWRCKYQRHIAKHKPGGNRVPCPHCDHKYATGENVRRHILDVHTKKSHGACDKCGKTMRKDNLKRHHC